MATVTRRAKRADVPLLGDWLRSQLAHERGIEHSTRVQYRRCIEQWIEPALGKIPLNKLEPKHAGRFINYMLDDRQLSGFVLRKSYGVIRRGLAAAVEQGMLTDNPFPSKFIPAATRIRKVPTPSQMARVFEVPEDFDGTNRTRLLLVLASQTGARVGELVALTWDAIDLRERTMEISQALQIVRGKPVVKLPKTASGKRTLHLPDAVLTELRAARVYAMRHRRRDQVIEQLPVLHSGIAPDGRFDDGFWRPDAASQRAGRMMKFKRIPGGIHNLRHGHAIMLLKNRVNPDAVRQRLGHSDIKVTLGVYGRAVPVDDATVSAVIDRLMGAQ